MASPMIDQMMKDLLQGMFSDARAAFSKNAANAGGNGGGGGFGGDFGGDFGANFGNMQARPYPGPTGGQTLIATAVAQGVAKGIAASWANMPSVDTAINMQLATEQARSFGVSKTYAGVVEAERATAQAGTPISVLDTLVALRQGPLTGFGGKDMPAYKRTLESISNVRPGVGLAGAADQYLALQAGRNVNMSKLIGVQLRDQSGHPKSIDDVVDQLWQQLNQRKKTTSKISAADIAFALLPGNSLDYTLTQYFGSDQELRQTVITMLYAKARGTTGFGYDALRRAGFTDEPIRAQSDYMRSRMELGRATEFPTLQGATAAYGQVAAGLNLLSKGEWAYGAAVSAGAWDETIKKLTGTSVGSMLKNVAGDAGTALSILRLIAMFLADGGPAKENKAYVVGERGPELFIPKTDGYVVPNNKLPMSMRGGSAPAQSSAPDGLSFDEFAQPKTNMLSAAFTKLIKGGLADMKSATPTRPQSMAAREFGGPVTAGETYLVGENGTEAFVPSGTQNINYGGVKIEITVPSTFTEEKMVRELKRVLTVAEIERKAKNL